MGLAKALPSLQNDRRFVSTDQRFLDGIAVIGNSLVIKLRKLNFIYPAAAISAGLFRHLSNSDAISNCKNCKSTL